MEIPRPIIPQETDADVAMSVIMPCIDQFMQDNVKYDFLFKEAPNDKEDRHQGPKIRNGRIKRHMGVADRTSSGDALRISVKKKKKLPIVTFALCRDSFYDILPEYLFHPMNHYEGTKGDPEEFEKRYDERVEQEKNALTYFHFFDNQYQDLRVKTQIWLNEHIFKGNLFLSDFITDGKINKKNAFIMAVYPCLAWLRNHRGCRQMMDTALHYAFSGNARVDYTWEDERMPLEKDIHSSIDGTIDDLFCGPAFPTGAYIWYVQYQTAIGTETRLEELQREIKEFEEFFSLWFLSVEDKLQIVFGDWKEIPVLTTQQSPTGIFLNYSTQLI